MTRITRRQFLLGLGAMGSAGVGIAAGLSGHRWWQWAPRADEAMPTAAPPTPWSVEAQYYASFTTEGSLNCQSCHDPVEEPLPVSYCHIPHTGNYVRCNLCPHHCIIAEGQRGICRVRENRGGKLYSVVYGNPCAIHVDPIEKKPFYHFLPSAAAFSLATAGCNLRCLYCQNWSISQATPEETQNYDLPPEEVIKSALEFSAPVIAYTYSEPNIFYEYMTEIARQGREAGLYSVVISAGLINPEPLRALCSLVDAIKIDLKGFDEGFYREVCGGELEPVLTSLKTIYEQGIHLEIVNLVVPTLNDDLEQLRAMARWVAQELSPEVPLHFSRFHPQYQLMNLPPTPVETLEKAHQIAREEGLRFVYIGNVPGHAADHTYCPNCGERLIVRQGFSILEYHLEAGACKYCGEAIAGVWWPAELEGKPVTIPPAPQMRKPGI